MSIGKLFLVTKPTITCVFTSSGLKFMPKPQSWRPSEIYANSQSGNWTSAVDGLTKYQRYRSFIIIFIIIGIYGSMIYESYGTFMNNSERIYSKKLDFTEPQNMYFQSTTNIVNVMTNPKYISESL